MNLIYNSGTILGQTLTQELLSEGFWSLAKTSFSQHILCLNSNKIELTMIILSAIGWRWWYLYSEVMSTGAAISNYRTLWDSLEEKPNLEQGENVEKSEQALGFH